MSYEFKEFAKDCNIQMPFKYFELDPLYTVNFRSSPKTYYLYKDISRLAEQFSETEPDFEDKMRRYLRKSGRLFHDTVDVVIKSNYDSVLHYLLTLMKVNPVHLPVMFRNFWQQVSRYFKSEDAVQILSLVAFFLGRTPFDTSSVYTLLSYTEFMHDGYFNVEGGMYKIIEGIVDELKKENVKITYNTEIKDFRATDGRVESVVDQHNREWRADIIVINADAAVFRGQVFRRPEFSVEKLDKRPWVLLRYISA